MKVGITADDYKVPMFENELTAAGFKFEKFPFVEGNTTIQVECTQERMVRLEVLVKAVNEKAIRNKAKEN